MPDTVTKTPSAKVEEDTAEHLEQDLANIANLQDHELGVLEAIRQRPLASGWCVFALLTCLLVSFENQAAGMVLGIPEFRKDFGYEYAPGNWVLYASWQSAFYGGPIGSAVIGTLGAGYLADRFGRKPMFIATLAVSIVAISMEFVATTNGLFFGGKFVNGFVTGVLLSVSVTYIGEIVPLPLRGIMTCMTALTMTLGPLTAAIIVNYTGDFDSRWAYRAIFCAQYGFAGLCSIPVWFLPESPVWLVSVGREEAATHSLRRLGLIRSGEDAAARLAQIHTVLDQARAEAKGSSYLDCFRGANLRRTIISIMPLSIQALSGVFFIASYATYYIQLAGYSTEASFKMQIAQHALSMFGNICSWWLVDHVGRRPLTFWGLVSITIILMLCAGLAVNGSAAAIKGSVAMILIYNWFYNVSIGATAYTLLCEVATSRLRVKTISIGIALQYTIYCVWAFSIPYAFNPDKGNLGAKTAFIFGALGVISLVYLWFFQVETAGRSYEELDEMFEKGVSVEDFKTYKTDVQRRAEELEGKVGHE